MQPVLTNATFGCFPLPNHSNLGLPVFEPLQLLFPLLGMTAQIPLGLIPSSPASIYSAGTISTDAWMESTLLPTTM